MPNTVMTTLERPTELRDLISQLIMVRIGSNLPPIVKASEDEDRISKILESCSVGGLMLFNGVWPDVRDTFARLQSQAKFPMLVASDIERGAGQQVAGLSLYPHQRAFVDLPNAQYALSEFCERTAKEAAASGIHITFGPVADANTNPRNPIISTRAFGQDPEVAAQLVTDYVEAAEAVGLRTTIKHFPGHGDTQQDSHDSMPRVEASYDELMHRELVPFKAGIEAGCSLIMSAHVEYPAFDDTGTPATLSRPILVDLLRDQLGFQGVVCSDSLLMAGVRDRFDNEGALALAALNAGVDLLLDVDDPISTVDYLIKAVEVGSLSKDRIDESYDRIHVLKESVFPAQPELSSYDIKQGQQAAQQVSRQAIKVLKSSPILPLSCEKSLSAVLLKPHSHPTDPLEQPLASALRERFHKVQYFETGPTPHTSFIDEILAACPKDSPLLVAMIVKPAAWHAFGLNTEQRQVVEALIKDRKVILVCFGVEEAFEDFSQASAQIVTYSDVPASQIALVEIISD